MSFIKWFVAYMGRVREFYLGSLKNGSNKNTEFITGKKNNDSLPFGDNNIIDVEPEVRDVKRLR